MATAIAKRTHKTPAGVLARLINPSLFSDTARACHGPNHVRKQAVAVREAERYIRALTAAGFKIEKKTELPTGNLP